MDGSERTLIWDIFSIYVENENIYTKPVIKHPEKLSRYLPSFRFVNSEQRKKKKKCCCCVRAYTNDKTFIWPTDCYLGQWEETIFLLDLLQCFWNGRPEIELINLIFRLKKIQPIFSPFNLIHRPSIPCQLIQNLNRNYIQ